MMRWRPASSAASLAAYSGLLRRHLSLSRRLAVDRRASSRQATPCRLGVADRLGLHPVAACRLGPGEHPVEVRHLRLGEHPVVGWRRRAGHPVVAGCRRAEHPAAAGSRKVEYPVAADRRVGPANTPLAPEIAVPARFRLLDQPIVGRTAFQLHGGGDWPPPGATQHMIRHATGLARTFVPGQSAVPIAVTPDMPRCGLPFGSVYVPGCSFGLSLPLLAPPCRPAVANA
jgi:hypothetical protein